MRKAHLKQRNKRCDTLTVLIMAMFLRSRAADMNACRTRDGDVNLHWPDGPAKNHFTHILDAHTGKRRPMTEAEKHHPVLLWYTHDVLRWRRRLGGRWVRPHTVYERQVQARKRRVRIFWELKTRDYGTTAYAERFARSLRAAGGRYAVMALITMANWRSKLVTFQKAGVDAYLMMHGHKRTTEVNRLLAARAIKGLQ